MHQAPLVSLAYGFLLLTEASFVRAQQKAPTKCRGLMVFVGAITGSSDFLEELAIIN